MHRNSSPRRTKDLPGASHGMLHSRYNSTMSEDAIEILKRALTLPVAERAELAGSLIESLDETEDSAVEAAWDLEVIRRMQDFDSGNVKPVPLEKAKRRLSSAIE